MSRLGILEVAVDNNAIPIRDKDDNNFDASLHESVEAGDSFEVSMLLQLGADPNSKDERGKSAVEIANEGGHTQIKEILLTGGRKDYTPPAESIYTAHIDYHGIRRSDLSFSEGEQLEVYEKWSSFEWKGRSLVSGDEGVSPNSCVYSMLESLQLLEFILSVEEVSLPILQKIRNDSSSNDEKASLFLETINDDPIMISALRRDKEKCDIAYELLNMPDTPQLFDADPNIIDSVFRGLLGQRPGLVANQRQFDFCHRILEECLWGVASKGLGGTEEKGKGTGQLFNIFKKKKRTRCRTGVIKCPVHSVMIIPSTAIL
uniref:SH3 domain-containing protein n=1 Tax=Amphimedon queenslandica TaxID=400682 RepID=A0A1X7TBN6_AMPQE